MQLCCMTNAACPNDSPKKINQVLVSHRNTARTTLVCFPILDLPCDTSVQITMSQVSEAIARYHKLIESEPYIDLAWAQALQERLKAGKLGSRPISPVLRPHFISNREYAAVTKAAEAMFGAIDRV